MSIPRFLPSRGANFKQNLYYRLLKLIMKAQLNFCGSYLFIAGTCGNAYLSQ